MKKLLSILLLISMFLYVVSCAKDSKKEAQKQNHKNKDYSIDVVSNYEHFTCDNLSEYQNNFLLSSNYILPEYFVSYDRLFGLGAFDRFITSFKRSDLSVVAYTYFFENGLYFSIEHYSLDYSSIASHPMKQASMFYADNKALEYETLKAHEILYYYSEGCLVAIEWCSNDMIYHFGVDQNADGMFPLYKKDTLKDYKMILQNSILSDFFHADTLPNAVQNFNEQVYGTAEP